MTSAVRINGLTRQFGQNLILRDISIEIEASEFVALLGRSGSGKTTLLRTLAGLDPVPRGMEKLPERRAVVFQEPRLLPWKRVWRNVMLGINARDARERAIAALKEVELSHRADAWPLTLSGGEAQRAALARAIIRNPDLLLLDEPFASLDALTRIKMQALVGALWRTHRPAVLLVTHDVDEALTLSDRVLILAEGRITTNLEVNLERPRRQARPRFIELRQRLLTELGVESELPETPATDQTPASAERPPPTDNSQHLSRASEDSIAGIRPRPAT